MKRLLYILPILLLFCGCWKRGITSAETTERGSLKVIEKNSKGAWLIETYVNKAILTNQLVCDSQTKHISLNNTIDSIVTYSSIELMTEVPFTTVYSHSGKQFEIVGEYVSVLQDSIFCIVEPPCCGDNIIYYRWLNYSQQLDTIESVCEIMVYTTTNLCDPDIRWYSHSRVETMAELQLRSTPDVNDIEEDEELRQIGNTIYVTTKPLSVYELGYSVAKSAWKLCAIQYGSKILIGWHKQ